MSFAVILAAMILAMVSSGLGYDSLVTAFQFLFAECLPHDRSGLETELSELSSL